MSTKYDAMNNDWNNYSKTTKIRINKSKLNSYLNSCATNADYVISYANKVVSCYTTSESMTSTLSSQQSEARIAYNYIRNYASSSSTEYKNSLTPYNDINSYVTAIKSSMSTLSANKSRANSQSSTATTMKTNVTNAKKTVSKIIL